MIDHKELELEEEARLNKQLNQASAHFKRHGMSGIWKILLDDLPFKLCSPYGLRLVNRHLSCVVPLYRQLIVPIRPTTQRGFRKLYGLTLKSFISLVERGRVIPILSKPHSVYPTHFDDLFAIGHIPQASRIRKFLEKERSEAIDLSEVNEYCDKLAERRDFKFGSNIGFEFKRGEKNRSVEVLRDHLTDLHVFGHTTLVKEILDSEPPDVVFQDAAWAAVFLTDPFTRGLGGFTNFEQSEFLEFRRQVSNQVYEALTNRLSSSLLLPVSEVQDLENYWNMIDAIDSRSEVLDAVETIGDLVRNGKIDQAQKNIEQNREMMETMFYESARFAKANTWKTRLDFAFTVLAPPLLANLDVWLGTGLATSIAGAKKFHPDEWASTMERLSYLLTTPVSSLGGSKGLAVCMVLGVPDL